MGTKEHCPKIQPQEYIKTAVKFNPFRRFPSTHRLKIESTSCQIEMPMTQVDFRNLSKSRHDRDNRTLSEDSIPFPTLFFATPSSLMLFNEYLAFKSRVKAFRSSVYMFPQFNESEINRKTNW